MKQASLDEEEISRRKNRLLAALPKGEFERLLPDLEAVSFGMKESIYEPNLPIEYVYFPLNGVFSLITMMEDGTEIEIATVGNEGMVGLPVFLGAGKMPGRAFSQVPGEALRLKAAVFLKEIKEGGRLAEVMHLYTQALFNQVAQSAACNRIHSIAQRCARWLLMTHNRVREDEFPLTHEFMGIMLGVRRAGVSTVLGTLKQEGLINSRYGIITIVNQKGLEARSCECFHVITTEYDRLLG